MHLQKGNIILARAHFLIMGTILVTLDCLLNNYTLSNKEEN